MEKRLHKTIKKVADDIEDLRFNTAIAALIELNNELVRAEDHSDTMARTFFLLLAPLAPHIAEELWVLWGFGNGDISSQAWPAADTDLILEETVTLPIQINGKVRGNIEVPVDIGEAELRGAILGMENIRKYVPDPTRVARFILVPRRIVNIVVK